MKIPRLSFSIHRFLRRFIRFTLVASLLLFFFVLYANWRIIHVSKSFIYTEVDSIPYHKVGVLLGTSKNLSGGRSNLYFTYRIDAASQLYHAGKIDAVLVSGDNGSEYYNEPLDMKNALMAKGIPSNRIYLDYAGFRTYDSMIRARDIFGQNSFTVISQRFHVQRAVYIARRLNMEVDGFCAADVKAYAGFKTKMREKLARVKVFVDFLFGVKPRFLGDPVIIP